MLDRLKACPTKAQSAAVGGKGKAALTRRTPHLRREGDAEIAAGEASERGESLGEFGGAEASVAKQFAQEVRGAARALVEIAPLAAGHHIAERRAAAAHARHHVIENH